MGIPVPILVPVRPLRREYLILFLGPAAPVATKADFAPAVVGGTDRERSIVSEPHSDLVQECIKHNSTCYYPTYVSKLMHACIYDAGPQIKKKLFKQEC